MAKPKTTDQKESLLSRRSVRIAAATFFTIFVVGFAWPYFSKATFNGLAEQLNWSAALIALGVFFIVTVVRAFRFILAGARLDLKNAFSVAAIHGALLRVMPLRSGELAYGILLKKTGGGGFSEGMAGLVMLRILDLATVLPLSAIVALQLFYKEGSFPAVATLGISGLFLVVTFFVLGPVLRRLSDRFAGSREKKSIRGTIARGLEIFAKTSDLPTNKKLALLGLTLANWGLLILWLNLSLIAVGAATNIGDGFTASILGITGSILPISLVGSFGPMESGLALGISAIGKSPEFAATSAIMVSALTFACNWIVALPGFFIIATKGSLSEIGSIFKWKKMDARNLEGSSRDSLWAACFAIAGGLLLLFRIRYGFETNDQFQYFLLPYRSIYENFLPGDWFTWQTSHYHVTFSFLIRGLHGVFGEAGFPNAVFVLHLFVLTGIAYAIYRISRAAGWHPLSAVLGLLIISFIRNTGIGGALVNHGVLLPADMALPPLLLGLASWIEGRPLRTGLWLGLSGLLHANFAVLGPLVIAPFAITKLLKQADWKGTTRLALGYVVLAWPALIIIVKSFLFSDSAPGAMDLMFNVRSPHHYDPSLLNSIDPWWLVALIVAGLPAILTGSQKQRRRVFTAVLVTLVAFQVLAGISTILHIGPIVRLFFWRLSLPLMIFGSVAAGQTIVQALKSRKVHAIAFATSAAVIIGSFSTKGGIVLDGNFDLEGFAILLPCLIPLMFGAIIPRIFEKNWARITASIISILVFGWAVFVTVPNSHLLQKHTVRWQHAVDSWTEFAPVEIKPKNKRNQRSAVYNWIRKNTPSDALFLTPPGINDFRMRTQRGMYVDWKCCPMNGGEILEWQRRMLRAMGSEKFVSKGYALYGHANKLYSARPLHELAKLAKEEGLTHILVKSKENYDGLTKLTTRGPWTVYAVNADGAELL